MNWSRMIVLCISITSVGCGLVLGQVPAQQAQETEQQQIRTVLRDCQFEETTAVYEHPKDFDSSIFTRCFVPETKGGKAVVQVQNSVQHLLDKGWHSSAKESKSEAFVFLEVKIFPQGDVAEVITHERWYLLMVDERERIVIEIEPRMEYDVTYRLVKIDGKWLIQSNTTPRRRS